MVRSFGRSRTTEHSNSRTVERFSPETCAAIEAAEAAGRILLRHFGRVRGVRLKGTKDPVTAADLAAERCIRASLARRFPAIGFLGEEGKASNGTGGRWIVDPLDGTIGFIAGLPFFAVSIGLERKGKIESGVILLPRLGELFVAERGRGAWLNGQRLCVSRTVELGDCVISLWHDDTVWRDRGLCERITRLALRVRSLRIFGAAFSLAYVAAGRLDGYWEQSAKPWDVAAGALLVTEAGGRVTDGKGRPFTLEQSTILASNGRIHPRLITALNGRPRMAALRRS
ncbi:MAG: inositol monophosphatase family protein [candidate division NC10 bacterium]